MSSEFDENGSGASGELVYITKTIVREDGHIYKETTLDGLMHAGPLGEPSAATYDPDGYPIMPRGISRGKSIATELRPQSLFILGRKCRCLFPSKHTGKLVGQKMARSLSGLINLEQ
ncbi:MAG: hypothetical protein AAFQ15_12420 [Pseudomonadota bacterium]